MRPGDFDDIVDLAEDPGSSRALASSRHPPEREPAAKRAYIGKPPPGWKKPTRFIIGKRPLSKCAKHVKRMRSPVFVNKSREEITQPREYPPISQETATTLREQSFEIPVEEGEGPSSSHTSSRTLANSSSSRPITSSLHRPQPRRIPRYVPPCQETIEDADLVVHDETHISNSRTREIPVRILRDFSAYDLNTKQLVNFEELQFDLRRDPPKLDYGASGFVEVCIDEDENVDDELDGDGNTLLSSPSTAAPLRVALSPIIGISTHHVGDDAAAGFKLNEQIYLLTEFAWYILVEPNAQYVALYASLYVKHKLFHELVVASLAAVAQHQALLLEDFKEILDTLDMSSTSQPELCITKDYLDCSEVLEYLAGNFKDLCAESPDFARPIRKVPAIHDITKLSYQSAPEPLTRTFDAVQAETTRRDSKTTVTPRVYELAKRIFFQNHLERILMEDDYTTRSTPQRVSTLRSHNHARVGCWWVKGSELSSGGYQSVIIDGIQYNVGDTVLVGQGSDENKRREKRAKALAIGDQLSDKYWFVKICSMFEDRNRTTKLVIPSFHGQWYYHGSKSLLHDLAHPRQLFPTDECHDNPLDIIVQKCNIVELGVEETPEPPGEGKEIEDFFSGIFWDQTRTAFCEISHEEHHEAPNASQPGPGEGCTSCSLRHVRLEREAWHVEDAGKRLRLGGVDFHIHDFIYLRPDAPAPALYLIGQIIAKVDIHVKTGKSYMVKVRVYERYDAVVNKDLEDEKKDERSLVFTDCIRTFDLSRIEGKAYAVHVESLKPQDRDEWASHDDHFLVRQKAVVYPPTNTSHLRPLRRKDFRCCQECHADRLEVLREQDALLAQHGPLQCLELFAGAGGLATGLHQSGFVKTKWAIELAPSAALSFAANNPDCTVYNQCTNVMLQHVVDMHCGRKPKPVFSRNSMERGPLPPMPKPGEVDFISGGPPCQSFSGANHLKRIDDIRTTLVSNMISYVEFYRPKYFLLENVIGMLSHRLGQKRDGVEETGMTIVKFIFRSLIALGYQVHCKVLQAAQYGAPQGRERVIFWGARRDVPLPDFPYPTHHYKPGSKTYDLLTGEALHRPVRLMPSNLNTKERDEYRQYAPFQAVTIQDAIGDLRKFDWISPHNIIEPRRHHDVERKEREARGIVSYSAVVDRGISASYSGSSRDESYLHPPLNRYQMQVRQGLTLNAGVKYHYTNRYSTKVVERVVNVPLRSGANHTNLPPPLRDDRKFETGNTSKRAYALHYGRLDKHGQFRTTITTVKPNTMNGCVLHPTQKRVLTVRECARAQGFPDSYIFESTQKVPGKIVEDQLRQIGNAVPVPLALALGKELGKALIKMWTRKQGEPERELSPEVPMEIESEVESE